MTDSVTQAMKWLSKRDRWRKQRRRLSSAPTKAIGTLDLVQKLHPSYVRPVHLSPMVELYERAWQGPTFATIHAPPQHGKTETTGTFAIATLLRDPTKRLVYATYEAKRAWRVSAKIRRKALEAGVELDDAVASKDTWQTRQGGQFVATGVGGPLTGEPADCLAAGTLVQTDAGPMPIEDVCRSYDRLMVLAFNHQRGQPEYRRIVAAREIEGAEVVEVITHAGRRIRCTRDHRFHIEGRGYRAASLLRPGDSLIIAEVPQEQDLHSLRDTEKEQVSAMLGLLSSGSLDGDRVPMQPVRGSVSENGLRGYQTAAAWGQEPLLLQGVSERAQQNQVGQAVQAMRRTHAEGSRPALLLGRVSGGGQAREAHPGLRMVRDGLHAAEQAIEVLRDGVQGCRALRGDDWQGQSPIQPWESASAALQGHAEAGPRAGRLSLRGLPGGGAAETKQSAKPTYAVEPSGSSHQRSGDRSQTGEPGHALPAMPHAAPQIGKDTVAMVRELRALRGPVYDLQVEGSHNFFANEVLVHNCILIDDPYKNRRDALSAAYNNMVQDWFRDVVESRTHKGSSIFIHHTRWHTGDLIGWIHEQDEYAHYESVRLPAIGEDGSILWPHRHSKEELLRRQRANPDQFEGLYQGRPPLTSGKIFPLATYCPDDYPRQGRVGLGMDAAYTEKKRGDSCALVVLREVTTYDEALHRQGEPYYVVELAKKQRTNIEEFTFTLRSVQSRFRATPFRWSGSNIEGEIARRMNNDGVWIDFQPAINDKLVRSEAVAMAWRLGRVRVPEGAEWAADFVEEVTSFTGVEGRPDDYVDALADAYAQIAEGGLGDYLAWIRQA